MTACAVGKKFPTVTIQRILDTDVTKHSPNSSSVRNAFECLDGQGNLAANQLLIPCSITELQLCSKQELKQKAIFKRGR